MDIVPTHQRTSPHPLGLVRAPCLTEAACNPLCLPSWKSQFDAAPGGQSPRRVPWSLRWLLAHSCLIVAQTASVSRFPRKGSIGGLNDQVMIGQQLYCFVMISQLSFVHFCLSRFRSWNPCRLNWQWFRACLPSRLVALCLRQMSIFISAVCFGEGHQISWNTIDGDRPWWSAVGSDCRTVSIMPAAPRGSLSTSPNQPCSPFPGALQSLHALAVEPSSWHPSRHHRWFNEWEISESSVDRGERDDEHVLVVLGYICSFHTTLRGWTASNFVKVDYQKKLHRRYLLLAWEVTKPDQQFIIHGLQGWHKSH